MGFLGDLRDLVLGIRQGVLMDAAIAAP